MTPSKQERLAIFMERLTASAACTTEAEAYELVCRVLDDVEDELSGVPKNPAPGPRPADGRMYPPQADNRYGTNRPHVARYRTAGHNVLMASNGAIEIRDAGGERATVFEKPGHDGRLVRDQ
jgi:hypothetical protein